MSPYVLGALLCAVLAGSGESQAARILAVFPHPGKSHFLVFEPLLKELAHRGHELVVLSHYPQKKAVENYRDVSLVGSIPAMDNTLPIPELENVNAFLDLFFITKIGQDSCDLALSLPPVKRLLRSNQTFDLIINEVFNTDCFLGIVNHFRAPYIAMSSSTLMPWAGARVGNPSNAAVTPNLFLWFSDEMNLMQRVANTLFSAAANVYKSVHLDHKAQIVSNKHFPGAPLLGELAQKVSLIFVNTHHTLNTPRPLVPAVVEVGGIHIPPVKELPKDLQSFVSGAKHGVIVFSMGSMIRTSSLPKEHALAIIAEFGKLKQRVIWKWEGEAPGPVPANVRLMSWLPQFDVLWHGGLLSTTEAAHCGVPMLGIAMYGDQRTNMAAISKTGAAKPLPYSALSDAKELIKHVKELINDPSYTENAKLLSQRFRDRPMSPLDTAVWWTEYVIRNKGAPELAGAAKKLSWWQEALLDVILIIIVGTVVLVALAWLAIRKLINLVRRFCRSQDKKKKKL